MPRMSIAAVVQAGSIAFDSARSVEKAAALTADAAARGAKVVVFPEAFIGGYPKGADFGARVGSRTVEGRRWFRRYFEGAIDVPGPETVLLGEAAKANGVWLVIGVIERGGGTLYCTALIFGPSGELAGKHRKLMPTAMERLIWGFGDGSTLPVVETPLGKIGAVICWENYMPMLRMAMYQKGVELYCAPTVDDREVWTSAMRHIAFEGRCFVLSACQFSRRTDYPADFETTGVDVLIRGGSVIVNPLGTVLAGPKYDEECILTAEIDLDEVTEGKFDLDVAGHYARPDVFHLTIDSSRNFEC
jgi:nitrilase